MCTLDKNEIFEKSLKAELAKRPHLRTLTPKTLDPKDEPGILFRARLQGYFAARKLCRLWVLGGFDGAIERGEPFVKWVDPLDSTEKHDGTLVFAHVMTILYLKQHEPEISVLFDSKGALKSSSVAVHKLQNYIWAYRKQLARRCHDMLKQKYSTKGHSVKAWEPLHAWLFANPSCTGLRMLRLMKFNKDDDDLFTIVAKCLWRLAHGVNRPWGVVALKPRGYSAVATKHKVFMTEYSRGLYKYFLFFIYLHFLLSHVNIPTLFTCV